MLPDEEVKTLIALIYWLMSRLEVQLAEKLNKTTPE